VASSKICSSSEETPTPLRQRFSNASSLPNNTMTFYARSDQSSPAAKRMLASGIMHGDGAMQGLPQETIAGRSRSSSLDKQKGVLLESDAVSTSNIYYLMMEHQM